MKTLQLIEKLSLKFDDAFCEAKRRHATAQSKRTLSRQFLFAFPNRSDSPNPRSRHEL